MTTEREWAGLAEALIKKLEGEVRADAKTFYRPSAEPRQPNGNERVKFLVDTMRRLLPRAEQMMRS
jgi:hypothetical protein